MTTPMKITHILAHPRTGSFNHAIADAAAVTLQRAGHVVTVHDLYVEKFDLLLLDP
ncbi:MAG: NAD(P)H-dependent oxidoreductase [Methanomicrobiales archaeon]